MNIIYMLRGGLSLLVRTGRIFRFLSLLPLWQRPHTFHDQITKFVPALAAQLIFCPVGGIVEGGCGSFFFSDSACD